MDFKYYEHSEWIAFRTKMQAIAKDVQKLEWKQSHLMTRISNLEFAQDLVMRKKWDLETVTKKTTKVLTELTGDCDECWVWKYDSAEDEIKDLRVSKCLEVASIQSEIILLQHDREVLDKEQDAWRDRLINESLMMSVVEFTKLSNPLTVSKLIYEKPEGRILKFWLAFLVIAASTSVVVVLSVVNSMFTIR